MTGWADMGRGAANTAAAVPNGEFLATAVWWQPV